MRRMTGDPIEKDQLFARLGKAGAARTTVVTPNSRLAEDLAREFGAFQIAKGLAVWEAEDIVSFPAFVARAYEDALHSELAAGLPLLLTQAQEQALWEGIIEHSEEGAQPRDRLLALAQAAAAARDAWKIAHAWRLHGPARRAPLNDDAEAFAAWSQRYERATRQQGLTDTARLADVVIGAIGSARVTRAAMVVRYGFDIVTPQQEALFEALAAKGCRIATCSPPVLASEARRLPCIDVRDEVRQAAQWARARLEQNNTARIGVVVPDLAKHRGLINRIFMQTMAPSALLPAQSRAVLPFNISLGAALTSYPIVDAAFLVLELAGRDIAFERASLLVRSPFIAAGEAEMTRRALADVELRKRAEPVVSLDRLKALLAREASPRAPVLAQRLERLAEFRKARLFGAQSPAAWGRAFSEAFALIGFPGERTLDSCEYQTLEKWHELLAQFAQLERVVPRMGYAQAVARLRRMAADIEFQPESPQVPVQILGVLESAGCAFDHLWVCGLTSEAWPLAARATPFLPIALQREVGIPESSAEASLELDRRITQGWLGAAREVVLSYPTREGDRDLEPSPLIAGIAQGTRAHGVEHSVPAYTALRDAIFAGRRTERVEDAVAPALAVRTLRGGSAILKDQAACPFRAFASHRLGAESLEAPHAGLDALERGSLVHHVLALAWNELENKHALDAIADADLHALLDKAAAEAVARQRRERPDTLAGRFGEIERRRLARLAHDWLDVERSRGEFSVFATESKRAISVGGLQLNARLDRVDETAEGQRIVIDYKTRAPGAGGWFGARPDEPQLPLYLIAAEPQAGAIAYAQVRAGDMKFVALAADESLLPQARTLPNGHLKKAAGSWDEQLAAWRSELEGLAEEFAAGGAAVDPKPRACEYCDIKPFCRIAAREGGIGEESADES